MTKHHPRVWWRHHRRPILIKRCFRPTLEILEDRLLLSAPVWPDWLVARPAPGPIATLDASQPLAFTANPDNTDPQFAAGATASIFNQDGGGEVRWYSFTLDQPSDVQLATLDKPGGQHLDSVVSLFDSEAFDPFYPLSFTAPPFDPQQHRLLSQVETGPDGMPVTLDRQLAAGTYYVAVSGAGDGYFNPFLANSGYAGSTGDYRLLVEATPLPLAPTDGPAVLAVDPGLASDPTRVPILTSSPLAIDVDFSSPIDPTTVSLLQPGGDPFGPPPTVQLIYNSTGQFGNGNDTPVVLNGFHYATDAQELQLQVAAPLGPGFYQLTLAGNPGPNFNPVLTDPTDAVNLGANANNPFGQDYTTTFQIAQSASSHDTADTAFQLGDITGGGLVQVPGTIGADPAYNPLLPPLDPSGGPPYLSNPAAQVDLYHFQLSGPGTYDVGTEVFAGRIGSTLDAAVSLFRYDPSNPTSPLQLVASNDNSDNTLLSSDGAAQPLFTDPLLDVGLTAGDYYVAVSSSGNMPDFTYDPPGTNGVFDPNVPYSGQNGGSTGPYVLNLLVQPAPVAPHVVATSIQPGTQLNAPPIQLTVTFDSHVNVETLANQTYAATLESTVPAVFFVGPNQQRYFPRLESYDDTTHSATFLLLDRLPNGVNELHLSGPSGLTGYGSVPLVGNDPSGDYVVSFFLDDASAPADPLNRVEDPSHTGPSGVQDLGVLFPHEVESGVNITGSLSATPAGVTPDSDTYTVTLLEAQEYQFSLTAPDGSANLPDNVQLTITDASGTAVTPLPGNNPDAIFANLDAGTYTISIGRSSGDISLAVSYQLQITLLFLPENPPPLSIGATPVLQIRLSPDASPPSPTGPPPGLPLGPVPLFPVVLIPDNSAATPAASTSSTATTGPSLSSLLLSVRADPLGGVTADAAGAILASAPPQVQGLATGSTTLAGHPLALSGVNFGLSLLALEGAADDPPADSAQMPSKSAWPSWKDWLDSGIRWLESLTPQASLFAPAFPSRKRETVLIERAEVRFPPAPEDDIEPSGDVAVSRTATLVPEVMAACNGGAILPFAGGRPERRPCGQD